MYGATIQACATHLYWRLEKILLRACLLFHLATVQNSFYLATVQNQGEDKNYGCF